MRLRIGDFCLSIDYRPGYWQWAVYKWSYFQRESWTHSRHAVEVAERYAEGQATKEELAAAWAAAWAAARDAARAAARDAQAKWLRTNATPNWSVIDE